MNWPTKNDSELFQIEGFIKAYKKLDHGREFRVIEERERPDRIVEDKATGEKFGIELTSEYLNDKSVPKRHMNDQWLVTPDNPKYIPAYENRILARINEKVTKARQGYDLNYPLILSVYVNEYVSIYMDEDYWMDFGERNDKFFDHISPFMEVVFWPLPNDLVASVRREQ